MVVSIHGGTNTDPKYYSPYFEEPQKGTPTTGDFHKDQRLCSGALSFAGALSLQLSTFCSVHQTRALQWCRLLYFLL